MFLRLYRNTILLNCRLSSAGSGWISSTQRCLTTNLNISIDQRRAISSTSPWQKQALQSTNLKKWIKNFDSAPEANVKSVIESLIKSGTVEDAFELYKYRRQMNSNFRIGYLKYLQLINALIGHDHFQDAIELIKTPEVLKLDSSRREISRELMNILKSLNSQNLELGEIQEIVDSLIFSQDYMPPEVQEAVMRLYLVERKNLDAALKTFQQIAKKHKRACYVELLIGELIKCENVDGMKTVLDISTRLNGRRKSLFVMSFAFTEFDRIDQAQKILRSLNVGDEDPALLSCIEFLKQRRKTKSLHNLLKALEGIAPLSIRERIYTVLLEIYTKQNDIDQIKNLCSAMDTENLIPVETIRKVVTAIYRRNGIDIPEKWLIDVDKSEMELHTLLNAGKLDEAKELLYNFLENGQSLSRHTLRYFLSKIANNGNTQIFEDLRLKFDDSTKTQLDFWDYECNAYRKAKQPEKYLAIALKNFDKITDLRFLMKTLSSNIIEILCEFPEVYDDYKNFAIECANKGFMKPVCILWTYNFINDTNAADNEAFYEKFFKMKASLVCDVVTRMLYRRKRIDRLRKFLNSNTISKKHLPWDLLGRCYSRLFDGLILYNNDYGSVLVELKKAMKFISKEHLSRRTIERFALAPPDIINELFDVLNKK